MSWSFFVELIGTVAGLCFMASAVPLAYFTIKNKRTDAPWSTILLVSTGALLMMVYGSLRVTIPLVVDMMMTLSCWLIVGTVKWKSEKNKSIENIQTLNKFSNISDEELEAELISRKKDNSDKNLKIS